MIIKIQIRINSDSQQFYIIFTYNILVSYLRMVNIPQSPLRRDDSENIWLISLSVRILESKWIEPQKEHIVFGWGFFQGGGVC
jgi:hypothetical protein